MSEERFERIETHHNFWDLETILYSIEGRALPIPIGGPLLFYSGCVISIIIFVSKVPGLNKILELPYIENPIIKYLGIPLVSGYLLDHIKLDGKAPYIYILDLIKFMISAKRYEHYKKVEVPKSKKIKKTVKYRVEEKTSVILKEKIDKKKYRYMYEYI